MGVVAATQVAHIHFAMVGTVGLTAAMATNKLALQQMAAKVVQWVAGTGITARRFTAAAVVAQIA